MSNQNYYNSQQGWQNNWDPNSYYSGVPGQNAPPPPMNPNNEAQQYNPNPYQPPAYYNLPPNSQYGNFPPPQNYAPPIAPNLTHTLPPNNIPPPSKQFGKMTIKNPHEGKIAPYPLSKPTHNTNKPAYTQVAAQKNIFNPPKAHNVFDQGNSNIAKGNKVNKVANTTQQTSDSSSGKTGIMPPEMKTWFGKLFEMCPPQFRKQLHTTTSELILQIIQDNKQFSLNWEQMPFPKFTQKDTSNTVSKKLSDHLNHQLNPKSAKANNFTNFSSLPPNNYSNQHPFTNTQPTNNNTYQMTNAEESPKDSNIKFSLGGYQNPKTKQFSKESKSKFSKNANFSGKEYNKSPNRKGNQSDNASQISLSNYSSPPPVETPEFIGTCTQIEKRYLRLTTAPVAKNVRPLYILEQTFELLKKKAEEGASYAYLCDQYKSMRQDLQVQRIRTKFTVQVYETHARLAIIAGDMGEYNSCQTQLRELCEIIECENLPEFTSYRILYFIFTRNFPQLNSLMSRLPIELKQQHSVQHAFSIYTSIASNNYIKLFKLYQEAPNLSKQMMNQFIERERITALISILRSTLPKMKVPVTTLIKILKFESLEEAMEFIERYEFKLDEKDTNMLLGLETNQAPLLKANQKFQVVDIKGQI